MIELTIVVLLLQSYVDARMFVTWAKSGHINNNNYNIQ